MKIAVLGAGAMGMLFGGYLSQKNTVWLVDVDPERVRVINELGLTVEEPDGGERRFLPRAVTDSVGLGSMDLVLVFVKSMYTLNALEQNKALIGPDTLLMTLQNGVGHEEKLLRYAGPDRVVIGTTQHNASVSGPGRTRHAGAGITTLGAVGSGTDLSALAGIFTSCGFACRVSENVRREIWTKLFTNTSASALTAIIGCPLGFIRDDDDARALLGMMCREAVTVANAQQIGYFDPEEVLRTVEKVCENSRSGCTSICADILNGRRTEVDSISGAVLDAAHRAGIPVPCHEMAVRLIHALEKKNGYTV